LGPSGGHLPRPQGTWGRRTPKQGARDDAKLLAFVKANPGLRSEEIVAKINLQKEAVASGLLRLRAAKEVKMQGIKRAATYTA
jgi:hypothetical protein